MVTDYKALKKKMEIKFKVDKILFFCRFLLKEIGCLFLWPTPSILLARHQEGGAQILQGWLSKCFQPTSNDTKVGDAPTITAWTHSLVEIGCEVPTMHQMAMLWTLSTKSLTLKPTDFVSSTQNHTVDKWYSRDLGQNLSNGFF